MNPEKGELECQRFELRRHSDGLIYIFNRIDLGGQELAFKRADGDYWIVFHERFGWVAGLIESDEIFGRPWQVPLDEQSRECPPEGIWVSRKASRSYVYDLVIVRPDE